MALLGPVLASCTLNPSTGSPTSSAPRIAVSQAPSPGNAVWVLSTVGLNVRGAPDPQGQRIATLTQGARLDVSESRKIGSDTWLHVRSQEGQAEGWVVDRPDLVIHRSVSQHVSSTAGFSILFPSEWAPSSGNPATFTGPSTADGGSMLIQTGDDPSKLLATPTTPGRELRQESPVEVYGRTTYLTIYRLDAGGFEYDVKVQFPKTKVFYLFDFKQPAGRPEPDTALFKQLLGSVIVPGEG